MALTPDQIKALLAKPEKKGGRSASGKAIDTSVRTYEVWFKLAHKILDGDDPQIEGCSNENCLDPRVDRAILLAEVNGLFMCRYCFLDGFGEVSTAQLSV